MTKERPILFNGRMVRAILENRKTQTRRPVKPQSTVKTDAGFIQWLKECPYGQPGNRLWVRETWGMDYPECAAVRKREGIEPTVESTGVFWKADEDHPGIFPKRYWKPSIHMPRWASRIMLEVSGVRVERVQEISPDDALAEGKQGETPADCVMAFGSSWDSIYAAQGFGWDKNPWVWVVEFKRIG